MQQGEKVNATLLDKIMVVRQFKMVERELSVKSPYIVDIMVDSDGETYYKRFEFYMVARQNQGT